MTISRATLVATADEPESRIAAFQWITEHRNSLQFVSENLGCGCCVDIWNIEGNSELLAQVPAKLLGSSAWANGLEA